MVIVLEVVVVLYVEGVWCGYYVVGVVIDVVGVLVFVG